MGSSGTVSSSSADLCGGREESEEEVERMSGPVRVGRLKSLLARLHSGASAPAQSATRSLIVDLIEGKLSPSSFCADLAVLGKSRVQPATSRLIELALPALREEYRGPLQRQLLYQSLLPATLPPTLTPNLASPPFLLAASSSRKRRLPTGFGNGPGLWGSGGGGDSVEANGGLDVWAWYSEEWRNIETLFTQLTTSMERLRYSMLLFQQRARLSQMWTQELYQHRQPNQEILQRKADVAVAEVKRIAVSELTKAVGEAERRAAAMVAAERARSSAALSEQGRQEDSSRSCWNCGRAAAQSCSACGTARYCGAFCQGRDWGRHKPKCLLAPKALKTERLSPESTAATSFPPATPPPAPNGLPPPQSV